MLKNLRKTNGQFSTQNASKLLVFGLKFFDWNFCVDESPETEAPPVVMTPTTPTVLDKMASTPSGRSRTEREQRSGNTLYQELSFQDADALGEMDEGADITGKIDFSINVLILFIPSSIITITKIV